MPARHLVCSAVKYDIKSPPTCDVHQFHSFELLPLLKLMGPCLVKYVVVRHVTVEYCNNTNISAFTGSVHIAQNFRHRQYTYF